MDLRDLKTFLHLAESRHFGRSARAMHVSPSTLSRQIQRLEEDLGQPLFVRDNRTVTLTEAGEALRVFAQQTLLQYQQLRHTIDQQGPSLSARHTRRWRLNLLLVMRQMRWKRWSLVKRIWRLRVNRKPCPAQWRFRCWRIWQ